MFKDKNKEELKSLLMKVKEESEKAGLKLSMQKAKIMASSPVTSWPFRSSNWNVGLLLGCSSGQGPHLGMTGFFSSCGGIFELPQGIHASSCVGPQKSYLPFEIRGRAGGAL